jgi:starch synthase
MKIAVISLVRRGGMVHFHAELVNSLSKIVPTIAIISDMVPGSYYSPEIPRLFVQTGQGGIFSTMINSINPLTWYRVFKTLRDSQADIFHVVSSHVWNPVLGVFIKILKRPLIYTMHDPEHHLGAPLYIRITDQIVAKMADAVVVLSKLGVQQLLMKGYPLNKVFYIPQGIYAFFSKKHPANVKQDKVILFFGRIEPYKGLNILLKAFSRLAGLLPDWKLVVAGYGNFSPYLKYINHPQIEMINRYISDDEVTVLMLRASLVVLPYIEATQSGVIPIAYAFARPVIATDVGGLGEMVVHGKTGLLVPPDNVEELIRAIELMTSDELMRSRMGNYAFEFAHQEWDWSEIARKHLELYKRL